MLPKTASRPGGPSAKREPSPEGLGYWRQNPSAVGASLYRALPPQGRLKIARGEVPTRLDRESASKERVVLERLILMFISLTRLRIRSFRFVPLFLLHTFRSMRQVKKAAGFERGALLADRSRTFWTMTAWHNPESMRRFMTTGSHLRAMPHLLHWCDEASVLHWEQLETTLPSWNEADKRMREGGRASKVQYPSPQHATLSYRTPRTRATVIIQRKESR